MSTEKMYNLISFLSTILPVIASSLLIMVISVNLYLKIRRTFLANVNCWFCNSWTKVSYDDRNSFDCPTCLQYNGFTQNGDYNKIIPEQHDELMNKPSRCEKSKPCVSNGLCALCNNNQQLKIFQLAHFVPMAEENYDVEIEHFQEQVEKAYKLCKKCNKVLNATIKKQNAWIFGNKLKNIYSGGIFKVADQINKERKMSSLTKAGGLTTIILVLALVTFTLFNIKFFTKFLSSHIPVNYQSVYNDVVSIMNTSKVVSFPPYFSKSIRINLYFVISAVGLIYHGLRLVWNTRITATNVNQLLCWLILFLISWVRFNKSYSTYILLVEVFSYIYLLSTAFSRIESNRQSPKISGRFMRKLVKNLEYTCTDVSCSNSADSENTSTATSSSDYLNKSTYSTLDVPPNNSFNTAASVLNSSFVSTKSPLSNYDIEINKSFNNLHLGLGSPKYCSSVSSFALKRPKPVLSPPKFQNVHQNVNSWVAGGFWRNTDGVILPQRTNLSSSSSESSGFGSQHNEQFVPFDAEFTRLNTNFFEPKRNPFYPNLQQNNVLIRRVGSPSLIKFNDSNCAQKFENWSDRINSQVTQSFRDLSYMRRKNDMKDF